MRDMAVVEAGSRMDALIHSANPTLHTKMHRITESESCGDVEEACETAENMLFMSDPVARNLTLAINRPEIRLRCRLTLAVVVR